MEGHFLLGFCQASSMLASLYCTRHTKRSPITIEPKVNLWSPLPYSSEASLWKWEGENFIQEWPILLFLGIGGTFVAHGIWIHLSTKWKTSTTGTVYYSIIPITMVLNTLVNDESHSLQKWSGAILILVANTLLAQKQTKS